MSGQSMKNTADTSTQELNLVAAQGPTAPGGDVRSSLANGTARSNTTTESAVTSDAVGGLASDPSHRASLREKQRELAAQERKSESFKDTVAEDAQSGLSEFVKQTPDAVRGAMRIGGGFLSWAESKVTSGFNAALEFGQTVVTDPKAALKQTKAAAVAVATKVEQVGSWAVDKAADVGMWIERNGTRVVAQTMGVGVDVVKGVGALGGTAITSVIGVGSVVLGRQSWSEYKTQVNSGLSDAMDHFGSAKDTVVAAGQAVVGFAKSVSDAMGLTDLAKGIYHLGALVPRLVFDMGRYVTGQCSWAEVQANAGKHLDGIGNGVFGGLKCFAELVGLADLGRAARASFLGLAAYGRREDDLAKSFGQEAAFNGAFAVLSLGALAATVSTAGAAAGSMLGVGAARVALKQAGKEVFKVGAEKLGQTAVEEMAAEALKVVSKESGQAAIEELEQQAIAELGANASHEAIEAQTQRLAMERLSQQTAEGMAKSAGERLAGQSKKSLNALSESNVAVVCREEAEKATEALLKTLKLTEHVEDGTYGFLKRLRDGSPEELRKELMESLNVSKKSADAMVKNAKGALRRGKDDAEIVKILEDGITKHVTEELEKQMMTSFKTTFRKALKGELDEPWCKELAEAVEQRAKQLGKKTDDLVDDLVESGWKGAREGIESAVRKAVREGVLRGMKRFRDEERRLRRHMPHSSPEEAKKKNTITKPRHEEAAKQEELKKEARKEEEANRPHQNESHVEREVFGDGAQDEYLVTIDKNTQQRTRRLLSHTDGKKVAQQVQEVEQEVARQERKVA